MAKKNVDVSEVDAPVVADAEASVVADAPVEAPVVADAEVPVAVDDGFTRADELAPNACPNCSGSGKSVEDECSNCAGKGTV